VATEVTTVLFTDLAGSTETAARLGVTAAEAQRVDHFASLGRAVTEAGGQLVKNMGDGIMAVFPSASAALDAAAVMQRSARLGVSGNSEPVGLRVGVAVGEVTRTEDGDAFGIPVVTAARLCGAADAGQVLVSDVIRLLTAASHADVLVAVGALDLKGLPEAVPACELRWAEVALASPIPFPNRLAAARDRPFVSRDAELAAVGRAVESGGRALVAVSGEPGIGKTRLVAEFARRMGDAGATVLFGGCDEGVEVPYQPFIEAVRQAFDALGREGLAEMVGPAFDELAVLVPELGGNQADGETGRLALFEAVDAMFRALARDRLVLVILDDLHWADRSTLLLVRHLVRSERPAPIAVVATYRDTDLSRTHPLAEVLADLRRDRLVTRVSLDGLSRDGVDALISAQVGGGTSGPLVDAVHAETSGNPFFVEEVIDHLVEIGSLHEGADGGWVSDAPIGEIGIPEGVREVVGRRLSRLSSEANDALLVGAVIGREFELGLVQAIGAGDPGSLLDSLDEALQAGLVVEVSPGLVAFRHALIRQTLEGELSSTRRVQLHWRVGVALAEAGAPATVVAAHLYEGVLAGHAGTAAASLIAAGVEQEEVAANEDAVVSYSRAIELLDLPGADDSGLRADALVGRGVAQWALAPFGADGRHDLLAAADVARRAGLDDRLALAASNYAGPLRVGTYDDEVAGLCYEALDRLAGTDSLLKVQLISRLVSQLGGWDRLDDAEALSREAMAVADRLEDRETSCLALRTGAIVLQGKGRPAEVEALIRRALAIASPATGVPLHWVQVLYLTRELALLALEQGDREQFDELRREYEQGVRTKHNMFWDWSLHGLEAGIGLAEGRFSEAKASAAAIIGEGALMLARQHLLSAIRIAEGRLDEVVPPLRRFVEAVPSMTAWQAVLAAVLTRTGSSDGVEAHVAALSADGFAQLPGNAFRPLAIHSLCEAVASLRDAERASDLLVIAEPYSGLLVTTGVAYTVEGAADRAIGQLLLTTGRVDESVDHLERALELEERCGFGALAARTRYWLARALLANGDAGQSAAAAASSQAAAERFGMRELAAASAGLASAGP